MDGSCIHLNDAGYEHMFDALWDVWFKPQEEQRLMKMLEEKS